MPELPDLEVFSKNLNKKLKGKILAKITVAKGAKVSAAALNKALTGKKLTKIYREGKQLRFQFDDNIVGMHLMLHGKLFLFDKKNTEKHTVATFLFKDDAGLALTDYQGRANITLNPAESEVPDATSKELTPKYLQTLFTKSKAQVKNILLDQKKIAGIGNAYADEILWAAQISPFSNASKIPAQQIAKLAKAIKSVLKDAQKNIIKKNPDIIAGEVRDFMEIHNPKKEKSPTGKPIKHTEGSSKTYYTDEQVMYE